jgi:hypothetical protein
MSLSSNPPPLTFGANIDEVAGLYQTLLTDLPEAVKEVTEDEERLSLQLVPASTTTAIDSLAALSPSADLAGIRLEYTLAEGLSGTLSLRTGGTMGVSEPCERDETRYQEPDNPDLWRILDALQQDLARRGAPISLERLGSELSMLESGGVRVDLALRLSVNKPALVAQLGWDGLAAKVLVFFFPCQFLARLSDKSVAAIEDDWFTDPAGDRKDRRSGQLDRPVVILLLGSLGSLEGEVVGCFGFDAADRIEAFLAGPRDAERLREIRVLCNEQCNWEDRPDLLAPDHFSLEDRRFGGDCATEIRAEFGALAAQLAVGYLADRTDLGADPPQSRFDGYRTSRVPAGRETWQQLVRDEGRDPGSLLALYRWAYENYSGDQLGVLRQLVSLELEEGPAGNGRQLLSTAGKLLRTARVNFQQLVRRNITEYFVARNQVVEFLREYTDEIGSTLSDLTGELVGNLYKTLAAIIAAIVAAELTQEPAIVVVVTAVLYAVYMIFIAAYLMPSVWRRFHLKQQEYQNNVRQFVRKDVLLKDEIERFQGQAYQASERLFYRYFRITLAIYLALAVAAIVVAVVYGLWL